MFDWDDWDFNNWQPSRSASAVILLVVFFLGPAILWLLSFLGFF